MNTLDTLIKLHKAEVDEQRQMLAKLQNFLDGLDHQLAELQIEQAREQLTAKRDAAAALTYGAYIKEALAKQEALAQRRISAAAAVELARDRLANLFEAQKRYEIVAANREAEALKAEQRAERIELDEIGNVRFARDKE
jgi:flagellar export protein FliJ